MDTVTLNWLAATETARRIRAGEMSSTDHVRACIDHIDAREEQVQAWVHFDREHALAQARAADEWRAHGRSLGALHGVAVGVKDIIDVRGLPTTDGSPLHAGRVPTRDAYVVSALRRAGALVMGKTVTTEFALYSAGKTRNPHHADHTPGGSSSGSAAAVAAGMVPLAIGSQTNGSVIRPASFCGVVGFKPSFGLIPRTGVLRLSRALDHVGVFARSVEDAALLAQVLAGHDELDEDTQALPPPALVDGASSEPPLPPRFAFVRTPMWDHVDADARLAFDELAELLGTQCVEFALPESARNAVDWHRTIMEADVAACLALDYAQGADRMSGSLREQIERGRQTRAVDYIDALARPRIINAALAPLFEEFDAVLTPGATGTAPAGLGSTGSPAFCSLWTMCGLPAVSLPLLHGENGLPIGVQLVGACGNDARLLRTARWLSGEVERAA